MTITGTAVRFPYTGNGIATSFPFTGRVFNASDITVYVDGVLQIVGYSVSFNAMPPYGGSVNFTVAPANTAAIVLIRDTPMSQNIDWVENDPDAASNKEDASDKLTNIVQELDEALNRTPKFKITSTKGPVTIDEPVTDMFLKFKDNFGNITGATPVPAGSLSNPVGLSQGGTGVNAPSLASLLDVMGVLQGGGASGSSVGITPSAGVITLPDPLTTGIFTVQGGNFGSITPTTLPVGTMVVFYYAVGGNVVTASATNLISGQSTWTTSIGDMSWYRYVGGTSWIEVHRVYNAQYGGTTTRDKFLTGRFTLERTPVSSFINGLLLTNSAGDTVNDLDISVGSTVSDDADPYVKEPMYLSSLITKRLDANWAVGTNQGGLDTGVVANGTYHVYVIKRIDTGVVDVLYSLSATAPTMPANYTKKQLIFSFVRAGGTIVQFIHVVSNYIRLKTPVVDFAGSQTLNTWTTRTLGSVPTGRRLLAFGTSRANAGASGLSLRPTDGTDPNPSTADASTLCDNGDIDPGSITMVPFEILTDTSAQIQSNTTATQNITLVTRGWRDYGRGLN
jgi:hypothetical protein